MNHFCALLLLVFLDEQQKTRTEKFLNYRISHCFGIYLLHSHTSTIQRLCVCVVHFTTLHDTTPPTPINYGMLVSFTVISSVFIEIYAIRFDSMNECPQNVPYFQTYSCPAFPYHTLSFGFITHFLQAPLVEQNVGFCVPFYSNSHVDIFCVIRNFYDSYYCNSMKMRQTISMRWLIFVNS